MSDDLNAQQLRAIQDRTRRRFRFSLAALTLYFSFTLAWTDIGQFLTEPLFGFVNGALLLFVSLILIFVALEFWFLSLSAKDQRRENREGGQAQ